MFSLYVKYANSYLKLMGKRTLTLKEGEQLVDHLRKTAMEISIEDLPIELPLQTAVKTMEIHPDLETCSKERIEKIRKSLKDDWDDSLKSLSK